MRKIPLSLGRKLNPSKPRFALVNKEDFSLVEDYKWCALKVGRRWYAVRAYREGGENKMVYMHRLLLGFPKRHVDHVNGEGWDNRRNNLRLCSNSENHQGFVRKMAGTSSKFRGVTRRGSRWIAQIKRGEKCYYLGMFDSEKSAAQVRDAAALKLFGNHAHLNFPICLTSAT